MRSTPGQAYQTPAPAARRWWLAAAWALLIWLLLSVPAGLVSGGGGGWLAAQLPLWLLAIGDKLVHAALFLVLAGLLFRALRAGATGEQGRRTALVVTFGLSLAYGVLMEGYQHLLPWRSAELADLLADALGAVLYALWVLVAGKTR